MVYEGNIILSVNIVDVKTFDRKSGQKGQEIVILTDKGYRCNIPCVDVSVCDFVGKRGEVKVYIEPITEYDKFVSSSGNQYSKNYPSFRIIDLIALAKPIRQSKAKNKIIRRTKV